MDPDLVRRLVIADWIRTAAAVLCVAGSVSAVTARVG
jgi:hypothetical protein